MKPYSSLYPKSKTGKPTQTETNEDGPNDKSTKEIDGPKGDFDMWRTVEKAMEEGTLDALRHSKDGLPAAPAKKANNKTITKKTPTVREQPEVFANRRERRKAGIAQAQAAQEKEDDSDGGFFE